MGVAAAPKGLGPQTRPKSWPTLGSFWFTCYLKIVFPKFLTLDRPLKRKLSKVLAFEIMGGIASRLGGARITMAHTRNGIFMIAKLKLAFKHTFIFQ